MKNIILLMISVMIFCGTQAQDSSRLPPVYLTMRNGKLIEFNQGKRRVITKDITLTDETTIHPNGQMDMGSGESHRLHRGQYLTMDGQIRRFHSRTKQVSTSR